MGDWDSGGQGLSCITCSMVGFSYKRGARAVIRAESSKARHSCWTSWNTGTSCRTSETADVKGSRQGFTLHIFSWVHILPSSIYIFVVGTSSGCVCCLSGITITNYLPPTFYRHFYSLLYLVAPFRITLQIPSQSSSRLQNLSLQKQHFAIDVVVWLCLWVVRRPKSAPVPNNADDRLILGSSQTIQTTATLLVLALGPLRRSIKWRHLLRSWLLDMFFRIVGCHWRPTTRWKQWVNQNLNCLRAGPCQTREYVQPPVTHRADHTQEEKKS